MTKYVELRFTSATYSIEYMGINGINMLGFAYIKIRNEDDSDIIEIDLDSVSIDNPEVKMKIENIIRSENKEYGNKIGKIPNRLSIDWLGKTIVFDLQEVGYGAKIGSLVIAETRGMFDDIRTWSVKTSGD